MILLSLYILATLVSFIFVLRHVRTLTDIYLFDVFMCLIISCIPVLNVLVLIFLATKNIIILKKAP